MISLNTFLEKVEQNISRVNEYSLGYDGSNGKCDCIGLIIGAYRLAGEKWSWTHGSNYAARNRTKNLRKVTKTKELMLGELVFKAKEPGDDGYDLPAKYKTGDDLRDYYHVGVVTNTKPFEIMHCTSVAGGIKRDTTLGKWNYAGEFDKVNYDSSADSNTIQEEIDMLYEATAVNSGAYLNLRNGPAVSYKAIAKIPRGDVVKVIEEYDDTWWKVSYNGEVGYAMRKSGDETYLQRNDGDTVYTISEEDKWIAVRKKAEELITMINTALTT